LQLKTVTPALANAKLPNFQKGGMNYLNGGSKYGANVEAEKGEVVEESDGNIAQVNPNGNTHEQGGEFLPNVDRVLENTSDLRKDKTSQKLKLNPIQIKALTGLDTKASMSHAKTLVKAEDLYEKQRNKITKNIELAARDKKSLDKYAENSTKLNIDHFSFIPTKEQIFDNLFNHQETLKQVEGIDQGDQAENGGKYMKTGGLSRGSDYGSSKKPYPSVKSGDFAGGQRSYPIPTRADAVDALRLAGVHNRPDVKAKVYAKYPDLKKQLGGYSGNKTGMKTPAGNSDAFPATGNYSFQDYLKEIEKNGFKYEGINSNSELQKALYDYKIQNGQLDDVRNMWKEGMHQTGMKQAQKLGFVDSKGNFKPGVLDNPENLKKLSDLYPDNMLGTRLLRLAKGNTPPRIWTDDEQPAPVVPEAQPPLDTSIKANVTKQYQPQSKFNEPLRWYDVASPVNAYMAANERIPEKYNPMEFNQLRYKLQDPTATLQQNQADYNSAVTAVQETSPANAGAQMANIANLTARKYAMNNQVLGQYENQNSQIKNNEILYNTQVRDKQSASDQQSREVFENKVLTSKAKQQEQKLTALDTLYKTIAENRALNRNGNLIMKFSRAFDQYGDYNGYQTKFGINPALGFNRPTPGTGKVEAAGGIQGLMPGKTYYNRKTGKVLRFDGGTLTEVK
jgi:hypothetical protein